MRSPATISLQAIVGCLTLQVLMLTSAAQQATTPEAPIQPIPQPQTQPAAPTQPQTAPRPVTQSQSDNTYDSMLSDYQRGGRSSRRLANTPSMFGDFLSNQSVGLFTSLDYVEGRLPIAAGAGPLKIADNNLAIPKNRVYFAYNHFHNALGEARAPNAGYPFEKFRQLPIDRYTAGFEKTFLCDLWSVELRVPVTGRSHTDDEDYRLGGGNMGNVSFILKRLIYESDNFAASLGVGIETPTGSDVSIDVPFPNFNYTVRVNNESVHLHPYLGFVSQGDSYYFWNGFVQCDFATNGNPAQLNFPVNNQVTNVLNPSNFLHIDLGSGVWLHRNPCARLITGFAAIMEVHYTTAMNDADKVNFDTNFIQLGSPFQRYNGANLTFGLHTEIVNHTKLRVASAFPVHAQRRFFDSEIMVSLIRDF